MDETPFDIERKRLVKLLILLDLTLDTADMLYAFRDEYRDIDYRCVMLARNAVLRAAGWDYVPSSDMRDERCWVPVFGLRHTSTRFLVQEWVAGRDVPPLSRIGAVDKVRSMIMEPGLIKVLVEFPRSRSET